jgi:NADH-quinone oxidoreductase subunit L
VPPFAGFFSKDTIIEATHFSTIPGHSFAYFAVTIGVFVTAFYSFRLLFLTFHGPERFAKAGHDEEPAHGASSSAGADPDAHHDEHGPPKESPWVVTVPLILLAIPSVIVGWIYVEPMTVGSYFGSSIVVRPEHRAIAEMQAEWHGVEEFIRHGVLSLPFWLAIAGIVAAWYCYIVNPALPARLQKMAGGLYTLLDNKYYADKFNDWFFAGGFRKIGTTASNVGDRTIIDGWMVNGSARLVAWTSTVMRQLQTGYIYHYALSMVAGVVVMLWWWIWVVR